MEATRDLGRRVVGVGGRRSDAVRAEAADVGSRLAELDAALEAAVVEERRPAAVLDGPAAGDAVAGREAAVADLHDAVKRYVELRLARDLVVEAVRVVSEERQVPLVAAAGTSFSELTCGEFAGLAADVVGLRPGGRGAQAVATMSDGTRDAMSLAFRLAAVSHCRLHADIGRRTQVLPFTHHRSFAAAAARLAVDGAATLVEIGG